MYYNTSDDFHRRYTSRCSLMESKQQKFEKSELKCADHAKLNFKSCHISNKPPTVGVSKEFNKCKPQTTQNPAVSVSDSEIHAEITLAECSLDAKLNLNGTEEKRNFSTQKLGCNPPIIVSAKGNRDKNILPRISPLFEYFDKLLKNWEREMFKHRLSTHLIIKQLVKAETEATKGSGEKSLRQDLFNICGEFGVTLFMPIGAAFEVVIDHGLDPIIQECLSEKYKDDDEEEVSEEPAVSEVPVILDEESPEILIQSPRLIPLSTTQMIHNQLPGIVQHRSWNRLYSISRDGDSFDIFLDKVRGHLNTVILVKTRTNSMFGAFATCCWERPKGGDGKSFYGVGSSFVFTLDPVNINQTIDSSYPEHNITCHKWSGANNYVQRCDVVDGKIAMGGGGDESSFAFCLQDYFTRGSTGSCNTFYNPPLVKEEYFDIVDFEVYGLSRTVFNM